MTVWYDYHPIVLYNVLLQAKLKLRLKQKEYRDGEGSLE